MAVADLSITTKRMEAVEFSMPWMNIGISIIYMKPKKAAPGLLTFMDPFSDGVWVACLVSILLVAMFTFIIGRFSPYEWFNPNFCVMQPEELETQWNLNNSVWHTVGALMQQGTDFCPVSLSGRWRSPSDPIPSVQVPGGDLLLLHLDPALLLHGQLGGLPHSRDAQQADHKRRRSRRSNQDQVKHIFPVCCNLHNTGMALCIVDPPAPSSGTRAFQ